MESTCICGCKASGNSILSECIFLIVYDLLNLRIVIDEPQTLLNSALPSAPMENLFFTLCMEEQTIFLLCVLILNQRKLKNLNH